MFEAADELAQRLGKTCSQLYAEALIAYLDSYREASITARLDRVYAEQPSEFDPGLGALEWRSIPREHW